MDTAVALVNAYLHINGYFTVTEYQVIESHYHGARANRSGHSCRAVSRRGAVGVRWRRGV